MTPGKVGGLFGERLKGAFKTVSRFAARAQPDLKLIAMNNTRSANTALVPDIMKRSLADRRIGQTFVSPPAKRGGLPRLINGAR